MAGGLVAPRVTAIRTTERVRTRLEGGWQTTAGWDWIARLIFLTLYKRTE